MSEILRLLEPADQYQHSLLMSHAFGKGQVVDPPAGDAEPGKHLAWTWGLFRDGRLLASAMVEPFEVCWPDPGPEPGDRILPMGGIGGVATWADARGKGLVERLLKHSLETMRDQGLVVSNLYPFAFAFYKKLGWDWVGGQTIATVPLRELPRRKPDGWTIELVPVADARPVLEPLWNGNARRHRCAFPASRHKWHDHLGNRDNRTPYVFVAKDPSGQPSGYLVWRYEDGRKARVPILVSSGAECDSALLSLLRDLGTQCETAKVTVPDGFPLRAHLCHWDLKVGSNPEFQGRVVDVGAAVRKLSPAPIGDGKAVVRIHDSHAPWNDGLWLFESSGGILDARLVDNGPDPDLTAPITAFSQLFYGYPALPILERAGLVETRPGPGRDWLRQLFPEAPVTSWDGF